MYKNVTIIGYHFEEIEKNMKFYVERRETHSKSKSIKYSNHWDYNNYSKYHIIQGSYNLCYFISADFSD